ncbi:MAG: HupE/UreJ family protein [Cyanobacteriota bacterium]|nr:HupE/UreJ family protein [Cyanobacteriota bacterium]
MKRFTPALIALAAGTAILLSRAPAAAHGLAVGGGTGGLMHPLLGLDHLLMLLAVGAAAALLSPRLLLWAGAGAVLGGLAGVHGWPVPAAEVWASLAVAAMGGLLLAAVGGHPAFNPLGGPLVAAGVALHAWLHGQESPVDGSSLLWWSGALFSSVLVCGGAFQLFKRLPRSFSRVAAAGLLLAGGALALAPMVLPLVAGAAG